MREWISGVRSVASWLLISGLFSLVLLSAAACGATPPPFASPFAALPTPENAQVITLGDIDPDEPAKKIRRFKPLADYLAEHLQEFGVREGRVVIARDIDEMQHMMFSGEVDLYFDSPFPALAVQERSGSSLILRRSKGGYPTYWSTYVARKGDGVSRAEDLLGNVIAFEKRHSTSGFLLPAATLIQRGFKLREVEGLQATVAPDEIGYVFSEDEQNTFELVRRGLVAGGAVSNQDYEELPAAWALEITAFDRTMSIPRQLVSARPGLPPPTHHEDPAVANGARPVGGGPGVAQKRPGQQVRRAVRGSSGPAGWLQGADEPGQRALTVLCI